MKHTRIVLAAALLLLAAVLPIAAADMDVVAMVDTSASMFPYFTDLMDYLIQDLVTAKLHAGDSFHLLSFASTPEEELSLDMGSEGASRKAFGRLHLLQPPLGRYTDLIAALTYLSRYTHGLPDTKPKTILLLTDGVHDPPPGSPNRGTPEEIRARIREITESMKKAGWTVHLLKIPSGPVPGEEGLTSYLTDIAGVLDVPIVPYQSVEKTHVTGEIMGFPALEFPGALGKVGSRFRAPFVVKNYKSESVIVKLSSVVSDGAELLERAVTVTVPSRGSSRLYVPIVLPSSLVPGDYQKTVTLAFENDIRISPTEGVLHFTYTGAGGISLPRINPVILLYIAIAIAAVALLVVVFILLRRRLSEIPAAAGASAGAASSARAESGPRDDDAEARRARGRHRVPLMEVGREEASEADSPPKPRAKPTAENLKRSLPEVEHGDSTLTRMIEMRVSEQNSHIGFRNIHRIPEGGSRGIGGGFSTYLIFLVPLPRRIAEIRNDGSGYTFIPLRQEFFPALSGPVKNCLGVDIPMVTPKGLGFKIRFRAWISPLEEINALMRLSRS